MATIGGADIGADNKVTIDGRVLKLSNLDKVLYPEAAFTKAQVIDYYLRIAPTVMPHLVDKPITLHRFPNGVDKPGFYEKNAPSHRPDWVRSVEVATTSKSLNEVVVDEPATLVWLGNLASLELHPLLAVHHAITQPTKLTFDLDPGEPATIEECCQVALELRDLFDQFDIVTFAKTSGSKGMQIDVPLNGGATYAETKPFAHAVADLMAARNPKLIVADMDKKLRRGKVLIDWSQNDQNKTTVAPYSLRARRLPWVSTPVTWNEIEDAARMRKKAGVLRFETADTLARVQELGDLYAGVASLKQELPRLG